jgi:DNA uptake protein ComE-like DNA-binding protein
MSSELRASDNRASEIAARQAIAGGERYAAYVLTTYAVKGAVPDPNSADPNFPYQAENLPVGNASFWFIGRDPNLLPTSEPVFGIVDEASKLNLNTATSAMLQGLPNMTPDLAAAIISWHTATRQSTSSNNASNTYAALEPPRMNKGAAFETVDELRLVYGATLDLLFGEDTNRNGVLDANEDDSDQSPPHDNQDGQLQPGILEYVTVYSAQPNTRANGSNRINISTFPDRTQPLRTLLQTTLNAARANEIIARLGDVNFSSVAEFFSASGMSADEFVLIHTDITASTGSSIQGLVNVNTASATVLACIPGIGAANASKIVAYRIANPNALTSFAWLPQVIGRNAFNTAGRYITDQSYQFSADVAAVGHYGRGYCREKVIFDMSKGTPRILNRQDLTSYGWALGAQVRQTQKVGQNSSS